MTVKQFLTYLECVPVDVREGQTSEEALLDMEIKFRVPSTSGQYSQVVSPKKIHTEVLPHSKNKEKTIIVETGMVV